MHPEQRGLTLVELLVAISILGLVAAMGWRGLDSIVRTRSALTAELEQTRGMQLAFAQLQSDCEHLASTSMLPNRIALHALANRLTLVRTVYTDSQPTRLQVVSYRVHEGKLTRRESPATRNLNELDRLWLAAINDTEPSPAVMLQSGVEAMTLRVWIGGSWQPPANSAISPTGLEVVLQIPNRADGLIKNFLLGAV